MGYDAFISYSSKDAAVADAVRVALEAAGVGCWIAPRDIRPSEEWPAAIMRGIGSCRVMVLVFSADANASPQIVREVERAVSRRMPVLPFKIDPTFPSGSFEYLVSVAHWQDASTRPLDPHLAELVRNVKALLNDPAPRGPLNVPSRPADRRFPQPAHLGICAVALVLAAGAVAWLAWPRKTADPPAPAGPALAPPPILLPDRLKGLPAEPALRLAYESAPPSAAPGAPRPHVQVGILARRAGQPTFDALHDGDKLASERDQYLLAARAVTPGWLYVFQVDATGKADWLFPENDACAYSAGANPLASGQTAQVPAPEAAAALTLDRTAGVEHVYFVYAAARWPALEEALSARPPPAVVTRDGGQTPPAAVVTEPNGLKTRGVGGMQSTESTGRGTRPEVELLFTVSGRPARAADGTDAAAAGDLAVIERWFRHAE